VREERVRGKESEKGKNEVLNDILVSKIMMIEMIDGGGREARESEIEREEGEIEERRRREGGGRREREEREKADRARGRRKIERESREKGRERCDRERGRETTTRAR
jgi:hypothetical protein